MRLDVGGNKNPYFSTCLRRNLVKTYQRCDEKSLLRANSHTLCFCVNHKKCRCDNNETSPTSMLITLNNKEY